MPLSVGLFSGLSVLVPVKSDEDPQWLTDLIAVARYEANEIVIVLEARADPTAIRPALGAFGEKVRLVYQNGDTKAHALNTGLREAKNQFVVFLDADVQLQSGQLSIVRDMLEEDEFVSVASGGHAPSFPVFGFVAGWFFGAKRSTFIEVGGWAEGFVEDVETAKAILRSGHRIKIAPFAVRLRRPVRRSLTKFLSVVAGGGRR